MHLSYDVESPVRKSLDDVVGWRKGRGLYHSICSAEESEESVHERFKAGQEHDIDYRKRHAKCAVSWKRPDSLRRRKLNFGLLYVCSQVYDEARLVPYQENGFSIQSASVLKKITTQFLPDQIGALRELHLDVDFATYGSAADWSSALDNPRLLGYQDYSWGLKLRTLRICLNLKFREIDMYRSFIDRDFDYWVVGLLRLRSCPLENVVVMMADDEFERYGREWRTDHDAYSRLVKEFKPTVADKQQYCEKLTKILLGRSQWVYTVPHATTLARARDEKSEREAQES